MAFIELHVKFAEYLKDYFPDTLVIPAFGEHDFEHLLEFGTNGELY